MEWAVYYADGSTFTSEDGPPESAPRVGVQCVLQSDERTGHDVLRSSVGRWYWRFGRWWDTDLDGSLLYRSTNVGHWCLELFGEWLPDERYEAIVAEAQALGKSAWKKHEQRP